MIEVLSREYIKSITVLVACGYRYFRAKPRLEGSQKRDAKSTALTFVLNSWHETKVDNHAQEKRPPTRHYWPHKNQEIRKAHLSTSTLDICAAKKMGCLSSKFSPFIPEHQILFILHKYLIPHFDQGFEWWYWPDSKSEGIK